MKTHSIILMLVVLGTGVQSALSAPEVSTEKTDSGLRVMIDGALFTEYTGTGAQRPYMYPIIGPSGANLARPYPMEKGGAEDHPHHRSFWFAHGAVNGVDFWADGDKHGRQVHGEISAVDAGPGKAAEGKAAFSASTTWVSSDGKPVLSDERRIVVTAREDGSRSVDFAITLKASHGEVVFGDTKEGTFALRLGPTLSVEGKDAQGHMVNNAGKKDGAVWGKKAEWVSDYGPDAKGEQVTVTVFDHPSNLRHPTWWHARTYGLFAANPFGQHDFEKLEDKTAGNHKLAAGESLTLRYRVLLAAGEPDQTALKTEFEAFSKAALK